VPVLDCACVMVCSRCTLLQGPSTVWWNTETDEAVRVNCPQIRRSTPPHVSTVRLVGLGKYVGLSRLSLWDLYLMWIILCMLSGSCFAIHVD